MLAYIKKLFSYEALDDEDKKRLEQDIDDYRSIVSSTKYADSNANTEHLERLLRDLELSSDKQMQGKKPSDNKDNSADDNQRKDDTEPGTCQPVAPGAKGFAQMFRERLSGHLELLDILEGREGQILPGQPVARGEKFGKAKEHKKFILRQFKVPSYIFKAIESNRIEGLKLSNSLNSDNYIEYFQALLWIEEAHQAVEMHRYDMDNVLLGKFDDNFFVINVPGLAEGRPSLMRGDKFVLKSDQRGTLYEGYIHDVREQDILVKLHQSLHSRAMDGLKFTVQFLANRTSHRRSHHGVCQFAERKGTKEIMFPTAPDPDIKVKPLIPLSSEEPSKLDCMRQSLNQYQRRAVINILQGINRPAPYIIFGPPGTGKTVTLVEAVHQVYLRRPNFKILVCANSNTAADTCAIRILEADFVPRENLIRLSAFYRMEKLIPPELEDVTYDTDMLDANYLTDTNIVVTTCVQSCALNDFGSKFDYVFIDEAGHANEAEALISISLLNEGGLCVLAGDHQQLGPVVMSKVAEHSGLGTSLLERLARRSVYQRRVRDGKMRYDERFITKLIITYRSDPRVMSVCNRLFYDNELKSVNFTPKKWLELFKVEKPILFHSVTGRDRREYLNPSWFNPNEAIRCLTYTKKLYDSGLKASQLGIITPYRRQIDKLKILFASCNLPVCKIATMEEFQGDEREVIIISTVRTRQKNLEYDKKFQLGFLFNPKRFNVAVSRAKWLVIVVGDPAILSRDSCWVEYMKEAERLEDAPRTIVL